LQFKMQRVGKNPKLGCLPFLVSNLSTLFHPACSPLPNTKPTHIHWPGKGIRHNRFPSDSDRTRGHLPMITRWLAACLPATTKLSRHEKPPWRTSSGPNRAPSPQLPQLRPFFTSFRWSSEPRIKNQVVALSPLCSQTMKTQADPSPGELEWRAWPLPNQEMACRACPEPTTENGEMGRAPLQSQVA
jgi:hypothetical protein